MPLQHLNLEVFKYFIFHISFCHQNVWLDVGDFSQFTEKVHSIYQLEGPKQLARCRRQNKIQQAEI